MSDKRVTIRFSEDEWKALGGNLSSSDIKERLFKVSPQSISQGKVHEDWYKLIEMLEDDFLDTLANKSGSRTNIAKWAFYLLQAVNGQGGGGNLIAENFQIAGAPHRYVGWRYDGKGVGEEDGVTRIRVLHPKFNSQEFVEEGDELFERIDSQQLKKGDSIR